MNCTSLYELVIFPFKQGVTHFLAPQGTRPPLPLTMLLQILLILVQARYHMLILTLKTEHDNYTHRSDHYRTVQTITKWDCCKLICNLMTYLDAIVLQFDDKGAWSWDNKDTRGVNEGRVPMPSIWGGVSLGRFCCVCIDQSLNSPCSCVFHSIIGIRPNDSSLHQLTSVHFTRDSGKHSILIRTTVGVHPG